MFNWKDASNPERIAEMDKRGMLAEPTPARKPSKHGCFVCGEKVKPKQGYFATDPTKQWLVHATCVDKGRRQTNPPSVIRNGVRIQPQPKVAAATISATTTKPAASHRKRGRLKLATVEAAPAENSPPDALPTVSPAPADVTTSVEYLLGWQAAARELFQLIKVMINRAE